MKLCKVKMKETISKREHTNMKTVPNLSQNCSQSIPNLRCCLQIMITKQSRLHVFKYYRDALVNWCIGAFYCLNLIMFYIVESDSYR